MSGKDGVRKSRHHWLNVLWCHYSLRQRRELRGDVHPQQPPERGHPAQLRQHLQRGQLVLHDPGRLRPVQRRGAIKPQHRGESAAEGRHPFSALRELIVPNCARAPTLELCCLFDLPQTEERGSSHSASVRTAQSLMYWLFCYMFDPFLYFIGNAFKDAMFSLKLMKTKEQAL